MHNSAENSNPRHRLYFWSEAAPIPPAADSVLDRLAQNRNLPGVDRLSLDSIHRVFTHHFTGITTTHSGMEYEADDDSFQVSFSCDDANQPTIISVSSSSPLANHPDIFAHLIEATRELGCNRIESAIS